MPTPARRRPSASSCGARAPTRWRCSRSATAPTRRNDLQRACEWRGKKYDAGFGWITGPVEYGGRGLPGAYEKAWNALEAQYQVPNQSAFTIGLGMVAPTILAHGSETAKEAYLAKMYRADIVACQLFSEPGAGSDLASLQTKAERDGDEWVITGQKVWTTGAHYSDIGEIIARTDADLPKHKGLTGFIVDMKAPGVEVRPLRQMTGGASFNEVFFNEVRVPDDDRLGDLNNGWNVALTTLMNERAAIGARWRRWRRRQPVRPGDRDGPALRARRRPVGARSAGRPHHPRPGRRATTTSGRWTRSRPGSCRARR